MRICFIGYGEVGQTFARQLLARGDVEIAAYDILFDTSAFAECAREAGVTAARNAADAARGAMVVTSAVTADAVLDVAREAQTYLKPGQFFFDINSASPNTKRRAAEIVNKTGAHYVEGAVMAAVLAPGITVPILAGGPAGSDLAAFWDVADEVFGSLEATYPGMGRAALAENSLERVTNHGLRRGAEMREAAEVIADMGFSPALTRAIADAQEHGAAPSMQDKIKKTA